MLLHQRICHALLEAAVGGAFPEDQKEGEGDKILDRRKILLGLVQHYQSASVSQCSEEL